MAGITMQHTLNEMVDQNKSEKTAFQARETALTKAERKKSITWQGQKGYADTIYISLYIICLQVLYIYTYKLVYMYVVMTEQIMLRQETELNLGGVVSSKLIYCVIQEAGSYPPWSSITSESGSGETTQHLRRWVVCTHRTSSQVRELAKEVTAWSRKSKHLQKEDTVPFFNPM